MSVVTSDGFNDMELVDGQYHYCNKAHITEPGVYEFISLGGVWISTNKMAFRIRMLIWVTMITKTRLINKLI